MEYKYYLEVKIWMDFIIVIWRRMKIKQFPLLCVLILLNISFSSYCENHIKSLTVSENENTSIVSPQLSFSTSQEVKEAIDNGIRISLIAKVQLFKPVSWWFDKTISNEKINLEVSYFTLGKLYVIKNKDSGEQLSFNDYEQLWKEFEKLLIFNFTKQPGLQVKFRIMLDKGALPIAMQLPVLFNDNWEMNTDWYYQELRQTDE